MNLKLVKEYLLKPCYNFVSSLSPTLAFKVRDMLYGPLVNFEKSITIDGTLENVDIFIDTSVINKNLKITGIQRVVLKICRYLPDNYTTGAFYGNKLITNNFLKRDSSNLYNVEKEIDIKNLKKIILLDSSWSFKDTFCKIYDKIDHDQCKVYAVVYDLIPIKHPQTIVNDAFRLMFANWHNMLLEKADHILCISKSVADDVKAYYESSGIERKKPLDISYFPLGADFKPIKTIETRYVREKIVDFVLKRITFLMVGTIEPRKGHSVVLKSITKLLNKGYDVNLLIIGRDGWKNEDIKRSIYKNQYYNKNILWIKDGKDEDLSWAYQNCSALICASLDEGYGLPIIEGAHYGIPIICSDIPVFREVSQGYADYFHVSDYKNLSLVIKKWLASSQHPDSSNIKIYNWQEAANEFLRIIDEKVSPYKII